MQNEITVGELLSRVKADFDEWEQKRRTAEVALQKATASLQDAVAKTEHYRQMLTDLQSYLPVVVNEPQFGEFAGMGIRDGIKTVLQRANRPLSRGEIAQQLVDGGMKSNSNSFHSNVSAILSVMQSRHREVLKTPQGWILAQPSLVQEHSGSEAAA